MFNKYDIKTIILLVIEFLGVSIITFFIPSYIVPLISNDTTDMIEILIMSNRILLTFTISLLVIIIQLIITLLKK